MTSADLSVETASRSTSKARLYLRIALAGIAAVLLAAAVEGYFHPHGWLPLQYWWLMMVALGGATLGLSIATRWQRTGFVAASFLVGFAAQLAFKDPFWFQHIHIRMTSSLAYAMLAALLLQAAVAARSLVRGDVIRLAVRAMAALGWARLALFAVLLCAASMGVLDAIGARKYASIANQIGIASVLTGLNLLSLVALIVTLPEDQVLRLSNAVTRQVSLPGSSEQVGRLDKWLPYWLAGAVFVVAVFVRLVVFADTPHIDEVIYLSQAEYFAQGRLTLPMPVSTQAFYIYMMDARGSAWFATAAPGWPLVLGLGTFFGVPWLVNPLLGAIAVLLLHRVVMAVSDRAMANLVSILAAVSPWFVFTSSTLMTHNITLVCALGAWALLLKARSQPSFVLPFIAGALMGLNFLTRPLDGIVMGGLTGLWTLSFLRDRAQWKTVLLYGLGCIVIGGLVFPYNAHLTGDAFATPLNTYYDHLWGPGSNRLGFGPDIGPKPSWGAVDPWKGHSPLEALVQAQQMLYSLNTDFLGWPIGSVSFALFFLLWGKWTRATAAMAAIAVATIVAQALYWYAAFDYIGPRYWFDMLVPMLLLTAAGIVACARRADMLFPGKLASRRLAIGIGALCLTSVLVYSSWLAFNKYPGFRGYHDDYRTLSHQPRFRHSLIFVSVDEPLEYENAFWVNDFDPRSDRPVFARDLGTASNLRVASAYPGRPIYFVTGRTHHSHERPVVQIRRGPVAASSLGSF